MNNRKAITFAIISAILWSTVATAFKFALVYYSVTEMLLLSTFSSFLFLLIYGLVTGKFIATFNVSFKYHFRSMLLGLINPIAYYLVLFKAYELLPAQEAQTLNYSWSITVVILSAIFLGQKIKAINIVALLISFLGVIIIAVKGDIYSLNFENPLGVFLALGSSIFWGLYWVFNIKDQRDNTEKLTLNFFYGSIFIMLIAIFFNDYKISLNINILLCVYIGLFEMGITFITWILALKYAENSAKVSNLIYISPFLSLFWINIFLGEKILTSTIIGLALIIIGILIQNKIRTRAV